MFKNASFVSGDTLVAKGHIERGDLVWGSTIFLLMFVPNIVFVMWFLQGHWNNLRRKDTCAKILIAGNVQLVTLSRHVYQTLLI